MGWKVRRGRAVWKASSMPGRKEVPFCLVLQSNYTYLLGSGTLVPASTTTKLSPRGDALITPTSRI